MTASRYVMRAVVVMMVLAMAGCGGSPQESVPPPSEEEGDTVKEGDTLVVTTWSGPYEKSFREAIVEPFEKEFGVKVELVPGWDEFLPKIQVAPEGQPPYDVFLSDDYYYPVLTEGGYIEELDFSLIPNIEEIWTSLKGHDAYTSRTGAPFDSSFVVFVFRKDLVDEPATTWQEMMDPRFAKKLSFDPNLGYNVTIADIMLGEGTMYRDMDAIFAKMQEYAGTQVVKWYEGGAEFWSLLERGEVVGGWFYAGSTYSGLRDSRMDVHVIKPLDGTFGYFDYLTILKGTKKRDLAHKFINYCLDEEVQQRFMTIQGNAVSNKNVSISPEVRDFVLTSEEEWDRVVLPDWYYLEEDWVNLEERLQREVISLAQ
jgi:spermidine/putrescine transport system substrate-binding protein